jgi:hypothetical protein
MAFDITNPSSPTYAAYVNSSDFTKNFLTGGAPAGDLSPEGVLFVRASDSPIGVPLLIVAHELSGTTAIYKIVGTATTPAAPRSLDAEVTRKGDIKVTWEDPVDDGGTPLTKTVVTAFPSNKTCESTNANSCVIAGLVPGVRYKFEARASNSVGAGGIRSMEESTLVPLLPAVRGLIVPTRSIQKSIARDVVVARKNKSATIALLAPALSQRVTEYEVRLMDASGEIVDHKSSDVTPKQLKVFQLRAQLPGRYQIIVVATAKDKPVTWRGPRVALR